VPGRADDVIVVRDEFLVGGFARTGVILLSSHDGLAWEDRSNGIDGGGEGTALLALATAPVGSVILVQEGPSGSRTMGIRFSADARQWRAVNAERFGMITGVQPADVVWTGREFFAVGGRPSGGDDPTVEVLVHHSADGVSWSVERSPEQRLGGPHLPIQATTWNGSLVLLATTPEGGEGTILVRGSAPGDWTVIEPPALAAASVRAVAATTAGLIFGGCTGDATVGRTPTIWLDVDGTGQSHRPVTLDGGSGCVSGIATGSDLILAMGRDGDHAVVWSSSDAISWDRQEPASAFAGRIGANALSAAQRGDTWVVVGQDLQEPTNDPPETVAIWRWH
jgi:hypothetical protein